MLYPDFNDLLSFKQKKRFKAPLSHKKVTTLASGNHHSAFRGQGLDFDAVRPYVPGDDIRNIDWRVTARTGSAHLKLFKEEKERQTYICIDMNSYMRFGTKNTFKSVQAARVASLLGWRSLRENDRVGALIFGDSPGGLHFFPSKRTRQSLLEMLKELTLPPKETHNVSIEKALKHLSKKVHKGSQIFLISDFIDLSNSFEKEASLSLLSRTCDLIFISINDLSDQVLTPAGMIGFCSEEGEKLYIDTDNTEGQKAFALQWQENRKRLEEVTKRFKIPLISLSTASDVQSELFLSLKKIEKRKRCLL